MTKNTLYLLDMATIPSPVPTLLALLREAADLALKIPPPSVTTKPVLAPSGDPHDYLSLGTYWWPNPNTSDGLPYIRRDGERNPECDHYDSPKLKQLVNCVFTLAWARYFTGEKKFSNQAVFLLESWFLDQATRMNPHLDYAQFIPGICQGRGIGIIDTATVFPYLLDTIQLLHSLGDLSGEDYSALSAWMTSYIGWLLTSTNGQDEAIQHNNHGTWYDAQLAALALFIGQPNLAAQVCLSARKLRIESQIQPDGSQPHELARTRSLGYSTMNLEAFINLAAIGKQVGVDLWNYHSTDGRSIRAALDWLLPYARGEKDWNGPQITPFDRCAFYSLYRRAALALNEPRYEAVLSTLPPAPDAHWTLLLYPALG